MTLRDGPGRLVLAAAVGIAVMLAANVVAVSVLRHATPGDPATDAVSGYDSFYDACAAVFTLAVPSFLGGLAIGAIARGAAFKVSAVAFMLMAIAGLLHPFWQTPSVSPFVAHSGGMWYMLHSPFVVIAFGATGGWIAGEFAQGRFTLADREPVVVPGSDD
jgi:hypothetical protein